MIDSNLPSLPTFLGKTQKTDYFQMSPSLPTFLGRSVLKSVDSKLWLGRLPSLPIFEGKSPPVLPTILGRYNFLPTNAKKAKDKICQYLLALLANHTLPRPCQQCRETGQELFVRACDAILLTCIRIQRSQWI